jgi:glycosyltransferase involved in cell wall biosynthesis
MTSGQSTHVTLITPAYNQADYLAATIDSVLAQDYPALEYRVFDDGSPDHTSEVLQRYTGRVAWERHANMGQSATLNKGWSASCGDYLGYLSADDLLLPNAITELARALDENPDVMVVYCDFDLIDAKGKVVGHVRSRDFSVEDLTEELICQPGVGALFRRRVFDECGGWDASLCKIPDFEFWLRASRLGRFMRVPMTLGQYRVHENSTAIRPIPVERTMEIVRTMATHWKGRESQPSARYAMARAHLKAAQSHGQSGRPLMALAEFLRAASLRPKTLVSVSSWRTLLGGIALRFVNRFGWLSARLR